MHVDIVARMLCIMLQCKLNAKSFIYSLEGKKNKNHEEVASQDNPMHQQASEM